MIFGLSKEEKNCAVCSAKIPEGSAITRSEKAFCSEEHADEYDKSVENGKEELPKKGGCCH